MLGRKLSYTSVVAAMVAAAPDSPDVQKMALTAARIEPAHRERTQMLTAVAAAQTLDPQVRAALHADPSAVVRAAVWRRGDAPLTEVMAMVATETSSRVRSAALYYPGLPADLVDEAARPLDKAVAIAVVRNHAHLPARHVLAGVRKLAEGVWADRPDEMCAAVAMPGVAGAVATDLELPFLLRLSACVCDEVDQRTIGEVIGSDAGSALANASTRTRIPTQLHARHIACQAVEAMVRGRAGLNPRLLRDLGWFYNGLVGKPAESPLPDWFGQTDTPAERGAVFDVIVAQSDWNVTTDDLAHAWGRLPQYARTDERARQLVMHALCDTDLFKQASTYLEDSSERALAYMFAAAGKQPQGAWIFDYPTLTVMYLRGTKGSAHDIDEAADRTPEPQRRRLAELLLADIARQPAGWPPSSWTLVAFFLPVTADMLAVLGMQELATGLLATDTPIEVKALVTELLTGLGHPDPSAAEQKALAVAHLLTTDRDTPARQALDAVDAVHVTA